MSKAEERVKARFSNRAQEPVKPFRKVTNEKKNRVSTPPDKAGLDGVKK